MALDDTQTTVVSERIDALAADLRELASLRSRSAIRDRVLPTVDELLGDAARGDRELRFAALQDLLDEAIEAMTDEAHQSAATALLGSGPDRWQPLTRRGPRAASAFHLGWDAYRRRRESTGASLLDETLAELAATLLRAPDDQTGSRRSWEDADSVDDRWAPTSTVLAPAAPVAPAPPTEAAPPAGSTWTAGTPPSAPAGDAVDAAAPPEPTGQLRRWLLPVIGVAVLLVAAIVLLGDDDATPTAATSGDDEAATLCGNLRNAPGALAAGAAPELERWSDPFRRATEGLDVPCAGIISVRDDVVYQQIAIGSPDRIGALVAPADPDDAVLVMTPQEFLVMNRSSWTVDAGASTLGRPLSQARHGADTRLVSYEHGLSVQRNPDDVALALVGRFHDRWEEEGGLDGELGLPLSNGYEVRGVGRTQDFEGGRLVARYGLPAIAVEAYEPTGDMSVEATGNIAKTESGLWFYVTATGERRWIPTENEFRCVERHHGAVAVDVQAIVLFELPAEEVMTCR